MAEKVKKVIYLDNIHEALLVYGNHDKYLRMIRDEFQVEIIARNGTLIIGGEGLHVEMVSEVFSRLISAVRSSGMLKKEDVSSAISDVKRESASMGVDMQSMANNNVWQTSSPVPAAVKTLYDASTAIHAAQPELRPPSHEFCAAHPASCTLHPISASPQQPCNNTHGSIKEKPQDPSQIDVFLKGVSIKPKSHGQAVYIKAIKENDLVFCAGPAGTGKTYLAVALALSALKNGIVKKIVLARPAVEAGERLGFLPGDIQAKVNPYLRPLYDALDDMMENTQVRKYIEKDLIEILPLAFMRGRTLSSSFVILDEAQNCTVRQMKTFLTRLGVQSRMVITGDITQIDLPHGEISGLIDVQKRLIGVTGIAFVHLDKRDIVRHKLVQDIVDAYEIERQEV